MQLTAFPPAGDTVATAPAAYPATGVPPAPYLPADVAAPTPAGYGTAAAPDEEPAGVPVTFCTTCGAQRRDPTALFCQDCGARYGTA